MFGRTKVESSTVKSSQTGFVIDGRSVLAVAIKYQQWRLSIDMKKKNAQ